MKNLLLLSSDTLLEKLFTAQAKQCSMQTFVSSDLQQGIQLIQTNSCHAVIANIPFLAERCPKKVIEKIHEAYPYIPIFILMDQIDVSQAISLTKHGAEYCYAKPFVLEQIIETIQYTLNHVPAPHFYTNPKPQNSTGEAIKYLHATSKAAQFLYSQIDKVADTHFKVIIYGETGTGKESVARRLCEGIFKHKPFIAVDCGCLSKELAASELFGHKKGSFSGALQDKKGAFEEAQGGTLFLDEIGNLDYAVQILLLRAIEEKKIKRVGCNNEIDIDTRIIVASNEKLSDAVDNGTFREDLYHRLNEFEICLPPLRDRLEDLGLFIDFFIQKANEELGKKVKGVAPELLEKFKLYNWPGNLRELKNVIRRGCLMASDSITAACLSTEFVHTITNNIKSKTYDDQISIGEQLSKNDLKLKSLIAEYEAIIKVLKEENYNKTRTARKLNINRKTLYNKLKTFNEFHTAESIMR